MADGTQFGRFLRSRRARMTPEAAGFERGPRRRVEGLRREECARLAGISVEYYTRLEQGRATRPSNDVIASIGRALHLDDFELDHLTRLAHPAASKGSSTDGSSIDGPGIRPELQMLIDAMDGTSAMVFSRSLDVIGHNHLAAHLFVGLLDVGPQHRNSARFVFLEPASRTFLADWEQAARLSVGQLHLAAARWPDDARLARLIGELSMKCPEFSSLWALGDVVRKTHGTKGFHHPVVGDLEVSYQLLDLPGDAGHSIETLTASPSTPSHDALAILGAWGRTTDDPGASILGA
jgi:transcriptional regulator with XRE-family HTH domain